MKIVKTTSALLMALFIAGCGTASLTEDIYRHAHSDTSTAASTSMIILAHTALSADDIEIIVDDYEHETNDTMRMYYAYLLSKRTQQPQYTTDFIELAMLNLDEITSNETGWVSITNPLYEHLAYLAHTNESALKAMVKAANVADGGHLTAIVEDLKGLYARDSGRVDPVVEDVNDSSIHKLIKEQ